MGDYSIKNKTMIFHPSATGARRRPKTMLETSRGHVRSWIQAGVAGAVLYTHYGCTLRWVKPREHPCTVNPKQTKKGGDTTDHDYTPYVHVLARLTRLKVKPAVLVTQAFPKT